MRTTVATDLDLVAFLQAQRCIALVVLRAITQLGSRQAIHVHRTSLIRQVEVAVVRIDAAAYRTNQLIYLRVGFLCRIELGDCYSLHLSGRTRRRVSAHLLDEPGVHHLDLAIKGTAVTADLDLVAFLQAQRCIALVVLRAITQLGSRQAIHVHRTSLIRQVEVAVVRIDAAAYRTNQLIYLRVGFLCRIELGDCYSLHLSGRTRRLGSGFSFLEALDGGIHHLVLLVLFIVLVGAGQRDGASVLHRRRPLVILSVLEAVHQDGAGIVGQIELHPILSGTVRSGLERRYHTRQAVIGILIGLGNEVRHRRCRNLRRC